MRPQSVIGTRMKRIGRIFSALFFTYSALLLHFRNADGADDADFFIYI